MINNLKQFGRLILILLILIILPTTTYFVMESSGNSIISPSKEKIVYDLPYPGILPDHPLYFLKIIRDRVNEFLIRDDFKKAQTYLVYSDKRVSMALALAKKGKNQAAISSFSKGEKYFEKIPALLKKSKNQGNQAPSSFLEVLKLANAKHQEIIGELIKTMPEGFQDQLNQLLELNLKIKKELETLP